MNKELLLQRVATNHNKLAQMIENGVDLKNGTNIILMGEVLSDLRLLAQEIQKWQAEPNAPQEQTET